MYKIQWFLQWNARVFNGWWEYFREWKIKIKTTTKDLKTNEALQKFQTSTEMKTFLTTNSPSSKHRGISIADILIQKCNSIIDDGLSTQINARWMAEMKREEKKWKTKERQAKIRKKYDV